MKPLQMEREIHNHNRKTVINNFEIERLPEIQKLIKRYNYTKNHIFIRINRVAKDINGRVIGDLFSVHTCLSQYNRRKEFWDFYYSQEKKRKGK